MTELQQATPHVKKNLLLIRSLLAITLYCFAFLFLQAHPDQKSLVLSYVLFFAFTFIPFYYIGEKKWEMVHYQFIVFSLDFVFLMGAVYLFDLFETNLLIIIFLTFFISALSQSVGRSILVGVAVIGLYVYLNFLKSNSLNFIDPMLLISCCLLFVVSIHSGYLAFRTVQEEKEIMDLAKKAKLLSEKVREGDQASLEYAATLKNVLDTLPIGAIAVSPQGFILFVNNTVGKVLDMNPKSLVNLYLFNKETVLAEIGETMAQSLKDRRELKREYLDIHWKGFAKRFRLDSSSGTGPTGKLWGTLFLIQEAIKPSSQDKP